MLHLKDAEHIRVFNQPEFWTNLARFSSLWGNLSIEMYAINNELDVNR